jgi:hypothetical protein
MIARNSHVLRPGVSTRDVLHIIGGVHFAAFVYVMVMIVHCQTLILKTIPGWSSYCVQHHGSCSVNDMVVIF